MTILDLKCPFKGCRFYRRLDPENPAPLNSRDQEAFLKHFLEEHSSAQVARLAYTQFALKWLSDYQSGCKRNKETTIQ